MNWTNFLVLYELIFIFIDAFRNTTLDVLDVVEALLVQINTLLQFLFLLLLAVDHDRLCSFLLAKYLVNYCISN